MKPMLLIVEGLDNTGKSTLIKNIRKTVLTGPQTTSIHCTTPPNGCHQSWPKDHYLEVLGLCRFMVTVGWTVILDRSHLGEDVFGPLFRNQDADYIYNLEELYFQNITVKGILLIDDPEKLVEREDGQSHTVELDTLQKVSNRFQNVFNKSLMDDKMIYHISNDGGFENLLPTVTDFINR